MIQVRRLLFLMCLLPSLALSSVDIGELPYEKVGKNSQGDVLNLNDYRGKVVILTFWATWCGPCMKELPVLSGIQRRVSVENLQVIAIGYSESKRVFKKVAKALSDNPIIFSYDAKGRAAKKYGVKAIPHMIIVGRDGKVAGKHVGYSEAQLPSLVDEINALLGENPGVAAN